MRRIAFALVVLAGTMWLPGRALAAPHSFDGSCQIVGVVSFDSYASVSFTFSGVGTCTGLLDGQVVQDTPVAIESAGGIWGFVVPVLGNGGGTLDLSDAGVSFPIVHQQLGTMLRVAPACMGCMGVAFGTIDPVTQPQPEPDPDGPRSRIRIVTQTVRTWTTP